MKIIRYTECLLGKRKIFCVLIMFLLYLFCTISKGTAQVRPSEGDVLNHLSDEITKSQNWKSIGTCSDTRSKQVIDRMRTTLINRARKAGNSDEANQYENMLIPEHIETAFFVANKGTNSLYSECDSKEFQDNNIFALHADMDTLGKISSKGTTTVFHDGKTYEIIADKRNLSKRELVKSYKPSVSTIGRYIAHTFLTPGYLIQKYGFKLKRIVTDPKFGKLLEYYGKCSELRGDVEFALAPDFGYEAVIVTLTTGDKISKRHSVKYMINELTNIQGVWLPREYEEIVTNIDTKELVMHKTYRFNNLSVSEITNDMLNIKLASGDYVWQEATKATYKMSPSGELVYEDVTGRDNVKFMWPSWLYIASVSTLLVAVTGAYINWKRKQLSKQV